MANRSKDDTLQFIRNAAKHNAWAVNPDTGFVETLAEGLTVNVNRYGYYLCPCRDGDGSRAEDKDIICPCVYAKRDVDEYGQCFCGLFLAPEKAEEDPSVSQIPERRFQG